MWFSKLFNRKKPAASHIYLTAQLNAKVQPIDRGDQFEDPLDDVLKSAGLGEISGGGTQMADDPYGIAYCDVEIMLNQQSDSSLNLIITTLEKLGAPKGSFLHLPDKQPPIPFGKLEGMAIFLNGVDLPAEVYANSDVNDVISKCDDLLQGAGKFRGHWQGNSETGLYFYGADYLEMKQLVAEFISAEPLCSLSRFEQIA